MLLPSIFRNGYVDDFMNDFFNVPSKEQPYSLMRTDVKELENGYEVKVELPGYKKEEIEAEVVNGYLNIHAEHSEEKETGSTDERKEGRFIRRERYYGSCQRRFYVGENVTEKDIRANFEDGVLTIDVPKVVEKKVEERKLIDIK